ncbi:MAG TPA: hypothetical protein VJT74_04495 [Pyrinomonadaceae bacterium]|nr:hypothetical protein [Pyrinomonadaceae bacterium]
MQFAQIRDRVAVDEGPLDLSAFPGTWVNSNPETSGIARLLMEEDEGRLRLQVYALGPEGLIDWGRTDAAPFTASPSSRVGSGFTCVYDFGFAETQLQAMLLKGLMVLAQLHRFKDASGRMDYFVREYFALSHGRY